MCVMIIISIQTRISMSKGRMFLYAGIKQKFIEFYLHIQMYKYIRFIVLKRYFIKYFTVQTPCFAFLRFSLVHYNIL